MEPGSSSVYAGHYLFRRAVREDAKRLKTPILGKLTEALIRLLALLVTKLAMLLLDGRPSKDTKLPIGWLSRGYKAGTHETPQPYATKADFIEDRAAPGEDMMVKDGCILPRETDIPDAPQ